MMIVDPYRFAGSNPASIAYQAAYTPTIAGTTATQTGVSFGAVAAVPTSRLIIVAVQWNATVSGSTISSATIGGVTAVIAVQGASLGTGPYQFPAFIAAIVPSGTSGTVVVNFGGGGSVSAYFNVWRAENVQSATPFGTGSTTSTTTPVTTTCNVQVGGVAITHENTLLAASPFTIAGMTKNYDLASVPGVISGSVTGGSALTPSAITGASFQISDAGGTAGGPFRSMIVASFR
jgi:hypothetical protein